MNVEQYGKLTVLGEGPREGLQRRRTAFVECECGTQKVVRREHLRSGAVVSCGCHRRAVTSDRDTTHGLAYTTPEYRVWLGMRERCTNPNNKSFPRYGGRGIAVDQRWDRFDVFLGDMGPRPGDDWSIDRVDNDGPYSPENCRWATRQQQRSNRGDRSPIWDAEEMALIKEEMAS